jgi:hypothetical protein
MSLAGLASAARGMRLAMEPAASWYRHRPRTNEQAWRIDLDDVGARAARLPLARRVPAISRRAPARGNPVNRLDVFVFGGGYTAGQEGLFNAHAVALRSGVFGITPCMEYESQRKIGRMPAGKRLSVVRRRLIVCSIESGHRASSTGGGGPGDKSRRKITAISLRRIRAQSSVA